MAQPLDVKRLLATGRQLTEAGRSQAFQLRDGLVEQGRETTDQISAVIDKLVNPVGRNRDEYLDESVQAEVQRQIAALDLVTKEDLVVLGNALLEDLRELERRLAAPLTSGSQDDARAGGALQMTPPHQRTPD